MKTGDVIQDKKTGCCFLIKQEYEMWYSVQSLNWGGNKAGTPVEMGILLNSTSILKKCAHREYRVVDDKTMQVLVINLTQALQNLVTRCEHLKQEKR